MCSGILSDFDLKSWVRVLSILLILFWEGTKPPISDQTSQCDPEINSILCCLIPTRPLRARWSRGRTRGSLRATAPPGPASTPSSPWSTWRRRSALRSSSWASWPTPSSASKSNVESKTTRSHWKAIKLHVGTDGLEFHHCSSVTGGKKDSIF